MLEVCRCSVGDEAGKEMEIGGIWKRKHGCKRVLGRLAEIPKIWPKLKLHGWIGGLE
jgi:hypothetical protein